MEGPDPAHSLDANVAHSTKIRSNLSDNAPYVSRAEGPFPKSRSLKSKLACDWCVFPNLNPKFQMARKINNRTGAVRFQHGVSPDKVGMLARKLGIGDMSNDSLHSRDSTLSADEART